MSQILVKKPRLAGYQKKILYAPQRYTVCEASTKSGKTFSHIYWLHTMATVSEDNYEKCDLPHKRVCKPGNEYWWIAPVYNQSEIAFNRLWRKVQGLRGYSRNQQKMYIRTPLDTFIYFKSADKPDNLFGQDVYAIVIDEASRAKYSTWEAARSTVTYTNGPIKLIGNFVGNANWQHQLGMNYKTDPSTWAYFKVSAWDAVEAGILTREEIEQAQRDLMPSVFKALYLAEGEVNKARWVKDEAIDDLRTNTHVAKEEGRQYFLTADIAGEGSDLFVVCVWLGKELVNLVTMEKSKGPEVINTIRTEAEKYKIPMSRVVFDADGIGSTLGGWLTNAKEFHNNGKVVKQRRKDELNFQNLKTQCYYELAMSINRGEYYIPPRVIGEKWYNLVEELEVIENMNYEVDGKIRILRKDKIRDRIQRSPDLTDAMMMRELFELKPQRMSFAIA